MALVFNMGSQARLAANIAAVDTRILLTSYDTFLNKGGVGDSFYAQMINVEGDREIVLVDVENSDAVQGLSVTRGVESTVARAWGGGTIIWQVLSETSWDAVGQKSISRQVAYIPDGALVSDYIGEKVYQSDTQMWWKAIAAASTEWRLIAGEIFVADVDFDPSSGTYPPGYTLTMSCITSGVSIYYTDDGTDPDETDTLYTAPITLPEPGPTTYKARAFGAERWQSPSVNITSGVYEIEPFVGVFAEYFERPGPLYDGYDNVGWSEATTANGIVDADALSSIVGSPPGWGTECLKIFTPSLEGGSNGTISPLFTSQAALYIRFEIVFTSLSLTDSYDETDIFRLLTPSNSWANSISVYRESVGVYKFKIQNQPALSDAISLDTVYRIEIHHDQSGWEWKVNGVTIDSGSWSTTIEFNHLDLGAIDGSETFHEYTAYFDKVGISIINWIGP
ncbi:MAG: chitobiase/beta-hexosaminidase C-terminal domain-containing protein [Deltaproteobacteria bacterium]|nr:chitobiase/beta-hexosaminidase C-terminal domain-containing protein [Deltaproteobacteria bacterium]MBW2032049.1 chitobiase/beta-hexosaminidase C-terminal domain-containing protein [Deltaproteobacteria bacterium]